MLIQHDGSAYSSIHHQKIPRYETLLIYIVYIHMLGHLRGLVRDCSAAGEEINVDEIVGLARKIEESNSLSSNQRYVRSRRVVT